MPVTADLAPLLVVTGLSDVGDAHPQLGDLVHLIARDGSYRITAARQDITADGGQQQTIAVRCGNR